MKTSQVNYKVNHERTKVHAGKILSRTTRWQVWALHDFEYVLWTRIYSKILKSDGRPSPVRASWSHPLCSCSSIVFSSYILEHYPFPVHHLALCKVSHYPNLLTSYPVIEIWCIESLTDFSRSNIATRASWSSWTPSQLVLYFSNSWK